MDVFIFRLSLIHHMGHVLLERLGPSPQMRKKYWDASESRTNLTPYDAVLEVDVSWRAGVSMISVFAWVEDFALKGDYYLQLRSATRHQNSLWTSWSTIRWPPSGKASSTCAKPS